MRYALPQALACLSLLFPVPLDGSTIQECAAGCSIWRWGPTDATLTTTDRQPEVPGTWNGHVGEFTYQDYVLNVAPFVWHVVGEYSGPGTLGAPVATGSRLYWDQETWLGGVQFWWIDSDGVTHLESVTHPVRARVNENMHAIALWQCLEGIEPPEPPYPFDEPEPSASSLMLLGLGLLALARSGRSRA